MLVSILIPCYNVEEFLPQCLDSVLCQTYKEIQVVLVDDGSRDGTLTIAQEYAAKDSRVEVYHQENQGVAAARNELLKHIKGDCFLFVDSDDWVEPITVEYLLSRQMAYNVAIVTCSKVLDNTGMCKPIKEEIWEQDKLMEAFLRHVNFSGALWNKFFKTSLLGDAIFRTDICYGEDALFTWQMIQKVDKICVTDKQLYNHRKNEGGISAQSWTPEKKGSGHLVWKSITENVAKNYPQYVDVAKARYAIEDMWGLYFASLANYPYDEHILERQQNVRENLELIRKSGLVSTNKVVMAYTLAYCYKFGKLLNYIKK